MARSYLPISLTLYRVYFLYGECFIHILFPSSESFLFVANFPGVEAARPRFTGSNNRLSICGGKSITSCQLCQSIDRSTCRQPPRKRSNLSRRNGLGAKLGGRGRVLIAIDSFAIVFFSGFSPVSVEMFL